MALGDTGVHGGMDKLETATIVLVHLGDDTHVTDALVHCTAVEEYEVARLQLAARNATSVVDLSARTAIKADAKTLEHITGETRAVEGAR